MSGAEPSSGLARRLLDSLPMFVGVLDREGRLCEINRASLDMVGIAFEQVQGRTLWTCPWFSDSDGAVQTCREACRRAAEGLVVCVDVPVQLADGRRAVFALRVAPMLDDQDALCNLAFSAIDISEHRRTEDILRESQERFREMADGLPLIIWVHDATGQQEMVNETFCEFFGVTRQEMKGGRWQALMHPDDADAYTAKFLACVAARAPFHAEVRVQDATGQWRWIESWGRPRFTASGEFRGFIGTSADITVRKRAHQALRESEQYFKTMADTAPALLWVTNADHVCTFLSRGWYDYTGQSPAEGLGQGWLQAIHPEDRERVRERFLGAADVREPFEVDCRLRRADGVYRWAMDAGRPRLSEDGQLLGYIGSVVDVHERRVVADALREADRRKDEFLAMLGHELRNPLAAIRSASELVKLTAPEDERLAAVHGVLERQSGHMARLIDGLLEVSRIARGKIELDCETLDLREIVDGVLSDRATDLQRSGLELVHEQGGEPAWVRGDAVRLTQVVDNLLANSIKFTPRSGRVTVRVHHDGSDVVIRVHDTGVGIRPELLPAIFEAFQQETQGIARSAGGLGLGLALVQGLVELHGGTVEAYSDGPGTGADFRVRLPRASGAPAPADDAPLDRGGARRILVVEDNADAALMLRNLLELRGHEVVVAETAARARSWLTSGAIDVCFCDIGLPDMSGYELAEIVRREAGDGLTLIALTGYGQVEDKQRAEQAGFDAHLTKPVDLRMLEEVLASTG